MIVLCRIFKRNLFIHLVNTFQNVTTSVGLFVAKNVGINIVFFLK